MASNKTISIGFKIEEAGKDGFKKLVLDAKSFKEVMEQNVVEADKLNKSLINFNSLSNTLDGLGSMFDSMRSGMKEMISAYDTQMQAERQLEQVMRNTMGARS